VFEARRRDEIIRTVQKTSGDAFSWVASPKPKGRSFVSGGLLLLSRFPIEGEPNFLTYSAASRVYSHGIKADGLAAKGVIHARLRIGDEPDALVDCFLTHLESISAKARAKQVRQLGDFIAEHSSPERPLLVMGDMNIAADLPGPPATGTSEYRLLLESLRHGDKQLVDLWAASHDTRGGTRDALAREDCNRIDYIFLSPPDDDGSISWQPSSVRVEPFLDANVKQGSLSDHAGVECRLSIRRNDWAAWYR
jgi:endonuclease/exonuclease/phosphatase family metal-dependent hydrolase